MKSDGIYDLSKNLLEFTVDENFLSNNITLLFAADDGLEFIEKYINFRFVEFMPEMLDETVVENEFNYTPPAVEEVELQKE